MVFPEFRCNYYFNIIGEICGIEGYIDKKNVTFEDYSSEDDKVKLFQEDHEEDPEILSCNSTVIWWASEDQDKFNNILDSSGDCEEDL